LQKKPQSWEDYKSVNIQYPNGFFSSLVSTFVLDEKNEEEAKLIQSDAHVNHLTQIFELGTDYWNRLIKEGYEHRLLTSKESQLLLLAAKLCSTGNTYLSDSKVEAIWAIRERIGKEGIII